MKNIIIEFSVRADTTSPFGKEIEEDVLALIRAVQKDPGTAQKIAANGQAFAKAHLTDEARWQYWETMLHRYAKLFRH